MSNMFSCICVSGNAFGNMEFQSVMYIHVLSKLSCTGQNKMEI